MFVLRKSVLNGLKMSGVPKINHLLIPEHPNYILNYEYLIPSDFEYERTMDDDDSLHKYYNDLKNFYMTKKDSFNEYQKIFFNFYCNSKQRTIDNLFTYDHTKWEYVRIKMKHLGRFPVACMLTLNHQIMRNSNINSKRRRLMQHKNTH